VLVDRDGEQNKPFVIHDEIVLDLLRKLDAYKSMELDGLHPGVLRELADVVAKPLFIIFRQSWLTRDVPVDWILANMTRIFKRAGEMILVATDLSVSHWYLGRLWNR